MINPLGVEKYNIQVPIPTGLLFASCVHHAGSASNNGSVALILGVMIICIELRIQVSLRTFV